MVLYYRLPRSTEADAELAALHSDLSDLALSLGGRFYLPYRHHYSDAQLAEAYPGLPAFLAYKRRVDPTNVFGQAWFQRYAAPHMDVTPRPAPADTSGAADEPVAATQSHRGQPGGSGGGGGSGAGGGGGHVTPLWSPDERVVDRLSVADRELLLGVQRQRRDSYGRTFRDPELRAKLMLFLRHVFHIEAPRSMYMATARMAWDPESRGDMDVYRALQEYMGARAWSSFHAARNRVRLLQQLRTQRRELTAQTLEVLQQLGLTPGHVQSYASVGDAGRLVWSLGAELAAADESGTWHRSRRGAFPGRTWVVHDAPRGAVDVVERGSLRPAGEFVPLDYDAVTAGCLRPIPSASVDLVTCNQGLHHFHPEQLPHFLREVHRVLRPGGVFLTREHDARPELRPLLDLAHSIFNVVTGVPAADEASEVRAFRPLLEWRRLVAACSGLEDARVYASEPLHLDPTEDVMMAFRRPGKLRLTKPRPSAFVRARQAAQRLLQGGRPSSDTAAADAAGAGATEEPGTVVRALQAAARDAAAAAGVKPPDIEETSTYWRLPEWFLVEVTSAYAAFMHHTPWYSFPYLRYIGLYWRLVGLEARSVADRHSALHALSPGLVMDVVIGGVLTTLFAQLQLLALPTNLAMAVHRRIAPLPEVELAAGASPAEVLTEVDHLLVTLDAEEGQSTGAGTSAGAAGRAGASASDHELWMRLDERLRAIPVPRGDVGEHLAAFNAVSGITDASGEGAATLPEGTDAWILVAPRHKPFTEVLMRLATDPVARRRNLALMDVSGSRARLQVQLEAANQDALGSLERLIDARTELGATDAERDAVQRLFDYRLPAGTAIPDALRPARVRVHGDVDAGADGEAGRGRDSGSTRRGPRTEPRGSGTELLRHRGRTGGDSAPVVPVSIEGKPLANPDVVVVSAAIPYLLPFLADAEALRGVTVKQVFDFL